MQVTSNIPTAEYITELLNSELAAKQAELETLEQPIQLTAEQEAERTELDLPGLTCTHEYESIEPHSLTSLTPHKRRELEASGYTLVAEWGKLVPRVTLRNLRIVTHAGYTSALNPYAWFNLRDLSEPARTAYLDSTLEVYPTRYTFTKLEQQQSKGQTYYNLPGRDTAMLAVMHSEEEQLFFVPEFSDREKSSLAKGYTRVNNFNYNLLVTGAQAEAQVYNYFLEAGLEEETQVYWEPPNYGLIHNAENHRADIYVRHAAGHWVAFDIKCVSAKFYDYDLSGLQGLKHLDWVKSYRAKLDYYKGARTIGGEHIEFGGYILVSALTKEFYSAVLPVGFIEESTTVTASRYADTRGKEQLTISSVEHLLTLEELVDADYTEAARLYYEEERQVQLALREEEGEYMDWLAAYLEA